MSGSQKLDNICHKEGSGTLVQFLDLRPFTNLEQLDFYLSSAHEGLCTWACENY